MVTPAPTLPRTYKSLHPLPAGMDREELYRKWQANKDRPAFVAEHALEIEEHTDLSEPVPRDGMFAVREWLGRYKGTVTRQLDPESDETPTTEAFEQGDE